MSHGNALHRHNFDGGDVPAGDGADADGGQGAGGGGPGQLPAPHCHPGGLSCALQGQSLITVIILNAGGSVCM